LEEPRERIWIGGKPVSRREFAQGIFGIQRVLQAAGNKSFTYFEIMTLLASLLFQKKEVDVAVFEVGMGGRLDATHVLPSKLVILTPIHYDHEAFLGNTLAEIAREKAAILQHDRDLVVAPQEPEVLREIRKVARKRRCPIRRPFYLKRLRLRLLGDFQRLNAALAIRAAVVLRDRFRFPVTEKALRYGVASNHWPGRMELFKGSPSVLLDGAHNPKSTEALSRNLKNLFPRKKKILVFGTSRDKRSDRMIPYLSRLFEVCILTQCDNSRAKEVFTLLSEAKGYFPVIIPTATSGQAMALARKLARPEDLIVVTGSFYLLGEIRPLCRQ